MASFFFAPDPLQSTFLIPGGVVPGNGAQVFIYVAGSVSTPTTVYKDNAGNTAWSNPIVLDSGGNLPSGGVIWIPSGVTIKAVWAPSNDTSPPTSPYRTIDNIAGINDVTGSQTEWTTGPAPTFVSANSFTLAGDQTGTFTIGRRLKFTVTAGTVYGRITNSIFGALSTVTMKMDGASTLDAGLSSVSYGILASKILSIPGRIATTSSSDSYGATVGITAYVAGDDYKITFSSSNTSGTPTLNLDALGALNLFLPDGTRPAPGQLNGEHILRVTNSTTFAILNPGIAPIRSYLAGLSLSAAASSGVMSTAAGVATDSGNSLLMSLSSAIWKSATSWTVGTGNGGLFDTGTVSTNSWYHFYQIKRPDTSVVDVGYSSSGVLPSLPAGYIYKRRIGSAKTDATTSWVAFVQTGDDFGWITLPGLDKNTTGTTNARQLVTMSVPTGIRVKWTGSVTIQGGATGAQQVILTDPSASDVAPGGLTSPLSNLNWNGAAATSIGAGSQYCYTNTSAQIGVRVFQSTDALLMQTIGWIDRRGRDD